MNVPCPGCGQAKSPRAQLCSSCRKRANAVGAAVVAQIPSAEPPRPVPPSAAGARTPGQNRAYHGKCATLAALEQVSPQQIKARALEHAALACGRPIASSGELNELEMSDLLDWLDSQLGDA